jgi:hypothetical protein
MDTNPDKLILKDEVFQIVGAAMEVLNSLGHGLHEKLYENALVGVILNFKRAKLEWERIVL